MLGIQNKKTLHKNQIDLLSREEIVQYLRDRDEATRDALAAQADADPAVLQFLAEEGGVAARRAVAANPSAPGDANLLLVQDRDDAVRVELARKIAHILPDLPKAQGALLTAQTLDVLEQLAKDQLVRVRRVLAEEIKTLDCVPKHIVRALAADVESVSAPILEYSPLLSDSDLIEIVTTAQAHHALVAVAKRRGLNANVSSVIGDALNVPAVSALLANASAQIRAQTLEKIISHASDVHEWHLPLVMRNDISQHAIRRIAGFVGTALLEKLSERHKLDAETRYCLTQQLRARIENIDDDLTAPSAATTASNISARYAAGELDDAFVEGLAEAGKREAIITALALLAKTSEANARRVLEAKSAKPLTALVWLGGLSMRTAFKIQSFVLHLQGEALLPARNGIAFPLTEDDMRWHLNYFGIDANEGAVRAG